MSGILRKGRPLAQSSGLITERVGGELVVYDGETYEAHCLKPLACAVFEAADGRRAPEELAAIANDVLGEPVDVSDVERALDELEACGLLVSADPDGISRRGLIERGAALGGVAVAASFVTTVATPAVGMAASQPSGPPGSFSGLAILIRVSGGTTYSAKWDSGYVQGSSPAAWGVSGPNSSGTCNLPSQPSNTSIPSWASQVTLKNAPSGFYVTVPAGDVVSAATMFAGNITCGPAGNKKCYTTATPTVSSSTSTTTTYYISIAAACYK